jgi:transposase-like protein
MKTSPAVIAEAISCKKRGMPYRQVSKHFKEYDRSKRSHVSVMKWVKKYGKAIGDWNSKQVPELSGKINIDEFVLKIKKTKRTVG